MKEIKNIFEKHEIILSEFQISQFEKYFSMLIETNKVLNLTAITEENEVIVKHFLDSVLPHQHFPKNSKVADVGSGAGFPAIPIKIIRPDLEICMIDSLNKRITFLNDVINNLELKGISAVHSRAEDYARSNRESFDIVVARAVAPLNTLTEYLLPLAKVGGKAIIYKSSKLSEELTEAKNAIEVLGAKVEKIENISIFETNIERNILILAKNKTTPTKYPRDKNKPKLNPIQ